MFWPCHVTESEGRGRPKTMWWWTVGKEKNQMEKTWSGIQVMAKDRQMCKDYVAPPKGKGHSAEWA